VFVSQAVSESESHFKMRSQNCEERILVSSCLRVCLFISLFLGMEQLGSYWTDFHEILYLNIFRKYVEKIQFSFNI